MVTTSGGVDVDSWAVAENTEKVATLGKIAAVAKEGSERWWWNAN